MKHIAPAPPPPPPQNPLLRHRGSIDITLLQSRHNSANSTFTTTSSTVSSSSSSFSSFLRAAANDFHLMSTEPISHGYVSLKDLLPSASAPVDSPKSNVPHLAKQKSWAYVQPAVNGLLRRLRPRLATFFDSVGRHIFRALIRARNWVLEAIGIRSSR